MPRGTRSHARDAIQAYDVIIKLQKYYFATPEEAKAMMSPHQVNVAKILLNKCIPDIKAIEVTGEEGKELVSAIKVEFVDVIKDDDNNS